MRLRMFQIDAFADRVFEGNPAAVCPLDAWLDDALLQCIAQENNLSETAFFVPAGRRFHLRWFTPTREVEMCGHATLASAYVLFHELGFSGECVSFDTLSGELTVRRREEGLEMDFPRRTPAPCTPPPGFIEALGAPPVAVLSADDYIAVLATEEEVRALRPDFRRLADMDLRGVIATAPGTTTDFVCRFFAPKYGIDEDPVTGSAFTELTPYWAQRLGKRRLAARQVSCRGGYVLCALHGERVLIAGRAVKYMEAQVVVG